MSTNCREFLSEMGILHRAIIPYQSEQNGLVECLNRTIMNCAEAMRQHARLPENFWGFSVSTAVHLINRRPHSALSYSSCPYEAWHGEVPNLNYLRVFRCQAFVHLPNQLHRKLKPRSTECIFVGNTSEHQKTITSRFSDATFDQNKFCYKIQDEQNASETIFFGPEDNSRPLAGPDEVTKTKKNDRYIQKASSSKLLRKFRLKLRIVR